jgi:hypothetical protein
LIGAAAAAAAIGLSVGIAKKGGDSRTTPSVERITVNAQAPVIRGTAGVVDSVVGEAYILHGGLSQAVVQGTTVGAGDQVVVQHAAAVTLVLPGGTRVEAEQGADITFVAQGATQLFRLAAGSISAHVQKLSIGERFVVRTLDAEVEVRGTSFRVANVVSDPTCGMGTTTRLAVSEGTVTVRSGPLETSVSAGHVWPSACEISTASSNRVPSAPSTSSGTSAPRWVSPSQRLPPSEPGATRSQLAEQNDIYSSALEARARGDSAGAVALFERLIARYPSAPLAETALAEKMKLLATTNSPRAGDAAREYLVRYPVGFARADAARILAIGTSAP